MSRIITLNHLIEYCKLPQLKRCEYIGRHFRTPPIYVLVENYSRALNKRTVYNITVEPARSLIRDAFYNNIAFFATWARATEVQSYWINQPTIKLTFDKVYADIPLVSCKVEFNGTGLMKWDGGTYTNRDMRPGHNICSGIELFTNKEDCISYGYKNGKFNIENIIARYHEFVTTLKYVHKQMEVLYEHS